MPAGIKINSKGDIFISIPRWKGNVYSTLNKLISSGNGVLLLEPFPSLLANKEGVATALQSVLGFEIDLDDNIWVLDQGKIYGRPSIPQSQKIIKFNSITGQTLDTYDLTSVTNSNSSFLNDIVLDPLRGYAYITDSGLNVNVNETETPALIVLNTITKKADRVLDSHPSVSAEVGLEFEINTERVLSNSPMMTGADGIALSCDKRVLYWTPLTSRTVYAIETQYLRNLTKYPKTEEYIIKVGSKNSTSDGMIISEKNDLYMTALEFNSIYRQEDITPVNSSFNYQKFQVYGNSSTRMMWPDTLGFDNQNRSLLVVSNQLHHFEEDKINFLNPKTGANNFNIWKIDVDDRSYLYGCKDLSADDDTVEIFPVWAKILVSIIAVIFAIIIGCVLKNIYRNKKRKRQALITN